jgi:hypothetical protein
MAKTKIEFEVEIPEGYEWTGEFRKVLRGELYISNEGKVDKWDVSAQSNSRYTILRKAEVWKQLTPEKAFEFMLSRKEVTFKHAAWKHSNLTHTTVLDKVYYNGHTFCIQLETESFISNVTYLEPDA